MAKGNKTGTNNYQPFYIGTERRGGTYPFPHRHESGLTVVGDQIRSSSESKMFGMDPWSAVGKYFRLARDASKNRILHTTTVHVVLFYMVCRITWNIGEQHTLVYFDWL